jgi:hypothetical protein
MREILRKHSFRAIDDEIEDVKLSYTTFHQNIYVTITFRDIELYRYDVEADENGRMVVDPVPSPHHANAIKNIIRTRMSDVLSINAAVLAVWYSEPHYRAQLIPIYAKNITFSPGLLVNTLSSPNTPTDPPNILRYKMGDKEYQMRYSNGYYIGSILWMMEIGIAP